MSKFDRVKYVNDKFTGARMDHLSIPSAKARFAMKLMEQVAIATAYPNGEDSAGRSIHRLLPPGDVVYRACAIADQAIDEFEKRGWSIDWPEEEDSGGDTK